MGCAGSVSRVTVVARRALVIALAMFILAIVSGQRQSEAAGNTCTWTNGAADNLWNNASNWSGCVGNVPGIGAGVADTAQFNGTSTANVTIDAAVNLAAFNINAGYSGQITAAATVITSGFTQAAGTYNGSNQNLDVNGAINVQTGTTFTAPSTTLTVSAGFTVNSGATFSHNSGTITFDGSTSGTLNCGSQTFNLITFAHTGGAKTVNSNCTFPMGAGPTATQSVVLVGTLSGSGTLTFTAGTFTLDAGYSLSGFGGLVTNNLTVSGATANFGSYSPFDVNGTLTMQGSAAFTAPSGTMTLGGALTIAAASTFTHNSGTVTFDGSTATLSCNSQTFNAVNVVPVSGIKTVGSDCTLPIGASPTIGSGGGDVTLNGTLSGSGAITAGQNFTINSTGVLSSFGGLTVNNTFTQSGGTQNFGSYSPFTVNIFSLDSSAVFTAPSGTLIVKRNFTITSSTYTHNGGTLELSITNSDSSISCNNQTFNLVTITATSRTKTRQTPRAADDQAATGTRGTGRKSPATTECTV